MKADYIAFRDQLIKEDLSRYLNPESDYEWLQRSILRGKCNSYSEKFVLQFPGLVMQRGFYNGQEHIWCVDTQTDEIIDPTVSQFHSEIVEDGDPEAYRVLDPANDVIVLGKCWHCRDEILGSPMMRNIEEICDMCKEES